MFQRALVIFNPNSGTADQGEAVRALVQADPAMELQDPRDASHAEDLAAGAFAKGFDLVVAAGGDGTVHQVMNGLMRGKMRPMMGIIPLGTGTDLPRTLMIPDDPVEAFNLLRTAGTYGADSLIRGMDVFEARYEGKTRFAHNVSAGGFSGQINEAMTDEIKSTWGPLAYLRGAISVLPDLTNYRTLVRFDDSEPEPIEAMNIIVANGRTAGGGTVVAPAADPTDGLLDVVIVRRGTLTELAGVAALLIGGTYTDHGLVEHRRVKKVGIESTPGMWFNLDGELVTNQPIEFEIVPGAIDVIVGPQFGSR